MPTSTYYLDAPSLASAVSAYTDPELTTLAPDGYYAADGIVREMASGVFLASEPCPACATACGTGIGTATLPGVYVIEVNLGAGTGVISVRIDPVGAPDGILVSYNGTDYNRVSSPTYGILESSVPGDPVYIGDIDDDCGLSGSSHTPAEYIWNGSAFVLTGITVPTTVAAGSVDLTVDSPGECVIAIPRPAGSPTNMTIRIFSLCPANLFLISVECPVTDAGFPSSAVQVDSLSACGAAVDQTYFNVPVAGASQYGEPWLYDWVFSDVDGVIPLTDGYYQITGNPNGTWMRVAGGIVVEFGNC